MIEEPNNQIPDDTPDWMRDMKPQPRRNPELPRPASAPPPASQPAWVPQSRSKWGQLAIELFGADYLEISFLLQLLRPPVLEGWSHNMDKKGWENPEKRAFMSYEGARIVIANRIVELGLSPKLVYAAPKTVTPGDWREQNEEWKRFNNLSFEKQMAEFR